MDTANIPLPTISALVPVYGDVGVRKQRRKRQKKLLVLLFLDFAKNTSLHGLRYVTETGLHIVEKMFWLLTFLGSTSVCFYFIFNVWEKWNGSPVIVSFNAKHVSIDEVPFPAVTICPQAQFSQKKFNYSDIWTKVLDRESGKEYVKNESNWQRFYQNNVLSLICDFKEEISYEDVGNVLNATAIDFLQDTLFDYNDVFYSCFWRGKTCGKRHFSKVLTRNGVCFTFNGLKATDILSENVHTDYNYTSAILEKRNWTLFGGYETKSHNTVYPFRGKDMMTPNMFLILKNLDDKKDRRCNSLFAGYQIFLHHPADLPQTLLYHFAALPKQYTSMGVEFTMQTAHADLKKYPVNIRQCYFPEDKPLKFFKEYTYNNCILECLTNFTYEKCECVAFYMPYDNSSVICPSYVMTGCVQSISGKFSSSKCACLPPCNAISYDSEIHKSEFNFADAVEAHYIKKSKSNKTMSTSFDYSAVAIFFKQPMFRTIHRSELYGLTDFLGNCGGLLGLFLGFSCLSLVEIFYFLTFRVYKTIKTDLKNEKAEKSSSKNA